MLLLDGGLGLLLTGLWIYALVDVVTTDASLVRGLTRAAWVLVVLATFEIGAIAWFVAGRPEGQGRPAPAGQGRSASFVAPADRRRRDDRPAGARD